MKEDQLRIALEKGQRAEELLTNETFMEVGQQLRDLLLSKIVSEKSADLEALRFIKLQYNAFDAVIKRIEKMVKDGRIAQKDLEKIEKQKKFKCGLTNIFNNNRVE